eukprot:242280-Amphidinium_carterae.2
MTVGIIISRHSRAPSVASAASISTDGPQTRIVTGVQYKPDMSHDPDATHPMDDGFAATAAFCSMRTHTHDRAHQNRSIEHSK